MFLRFHKHRTCRRLCQKSRSKQSLSTGKGSPKMSLDEGAHLYVYRRLLKIISAFRYRGHYAASLDPLGATGAERKFGSAYKRDEEPDVVRFLKAWDPKTGNLELDLSVFPKMNKIENIDDVLDDKIFSMFGELGVVDDTSTASNNNKPKDKKEELWSINEMVDALSRTYASNVGVEMVHIENEIQGAWLLGKIEAELGKGKSLWTLKNETQQMRNLERMIKTDHTNTFLNKKYPAAKVFGIEGCESLLPGLWTIIGRASQKFGVECVEMGMAHRGRMNVLHNLMGKSLSSICNDFAEADTQYGDVKYHLGTRGNIVTKSLRRGVEKPVHISLSANPSHLEAVNPVVIGKCKAKQVVLKDEEQSKIIPLLIHGDASFCGQGVVAETLELSNMREYTVGGCIHVIVNNQIGFTTDPRDARTAFHCTDVAKGVGAPIFHVCGDDVDAVVSVCKLALDWRMKFKRDVVIDIVCYRRYGHNEQDDPKITHPTMYDKINKHPSTLEIYSEKLIKQGLITQEQFKTMSDNISQEYHDEYESSKQYVPDPLQWLQGNWQGDAIGSMISGRPFNPTGVRPQILYAIGKALTFIPDNIEAHPEIKKLIRQRENMLQSGEGVSWAFAEALAFGSLVTKYSPTDRQGIFSMSEESNAAEHDEWSEFESEMVTHPTVHVRLSGQDCIRGTFNQRHSAIICQKTNDSYWPLKNLFITGFDEQAEVTVCNSNLSEFAVLGYEYGYSLSNEMALTIFEAQFGDFSNNAQCIIDNFIASGEQKWNNKSSLVLLLPHGYEGNGPEHSSGRIERFLSLVDDDADSIPGKGAYSRAEIEAGFDAMDKNGSGVIDKSDILEALVKFTGRRPEGMKLELDELMADLGVRNDSKYEGIITKKMWAQTMRAWLLASAERKHNLIVTVPSTPAQYFHVLRRQIHRPFAKPCIVFSAKWLLHHKLCVSSLKALSLGTHFQRVINEGDKGDNTSHRMKQPLVADNEIERVVFCSGKIFYHLFHAREVAGIRNIRLVRIEQIAPFPYDLIAPVLLQYKNADIVWCQEEPKNQGAYAYVKPRIETTMRDLVDPRSSLFPSSKGAHFTELKNVHYIGRVPSAASANGGFKQHMLDQKEIVEAALDLDNFHHRHDNSRRK